MRLIVALHLDGLTPFDAAETWYLRPGPCTPGRGAKRAAYGHCVWHDNEKFLEQPTVYARRSRCEKSLHDQKHNYLGAQAAFPGIGPEYMVVLVVLVAAQVPANRRSPVWMP